MQVNRIDVDPDRARALYRKYKSHLHHQNPVDWEIQRTYQLIAQGRMVIQALASIAAAGADEQGRPRLAIARADAEACWYRRYGPGALMASSQDALWRHAWRRDQISTCFRFPADAFPELTVKRGWAVRAVMPHIPPDLRPRRALQNYHVLWEADWEDVPVDPMLLRRIGKADLWLVVGAWDLTEVERAVLRTRVASA